MLASEQKKRMKAVLKAMSGGYGMPTVIVDGIPWVTNGYVLFRAQPEGGLWSAVREIFRLSNLSLSESMWVDGLAETVVKRVESEKFGERPLPTIGKTVARYTERLGEAKPVKRAEGPGGSGFVYVKGSHRDARIKRIYGESVVNDAYLQAVEAEWNVSDYVVETVTGEDGQVARFQKRKTTEIEWRTLGKEDALLGLVDGELVAVIMPLRY